MKVLLCCAGGLSSSILMKKMKTWADAHGEDLEIQAMGTGEAVETWQNGYECVLLAPQVSYRLEAAAGGNQAAHRRSSLSGLCHR